MALKKFKINEEIPYWYKEVRLIGNETETRIVTLKEAKDIANEKCLDLIEINDRSNPPIIRIDNYKKFCYELKKQEKKKKKGKTELKEIQISATIALHDLETKVKKASEFIKKGDTVKIVLTLKGREMTYKENNMKSLYEFIEKMEETAVPLSLPKEIGNKFVVIMKRK